MTTPFENLPKVARRTCGGEVTKAGSLDCCTNVLVMLERSGCTGVFGAGTGGPSVRHLAHIAS